MPFLRRLAWFAAFAAIILAALFSVFIGWRMMQLENVQDTADQAKVETSQ